MPRCLARNTGEVIQWCHYLQAFGLIPSKERQSVTYLPESQRGSEEWKQRFESLEKFREELKACSIESKSIKEIIDSIESEDVGEWSNFAAASAGAKILGSNPEARNTWKVIDGKKDTFMKNDCKADQWLVIELSSASKVKMIEITMKELYSPRIALINVYSRLHTVPKNFTGYPEKFNASKWSFLTEIWPENRKGTQHFAVISREWVKYIGLQIVKYHGMGTKCTVNDIGVYGLSPINDLEPLLETATPEAEDPPSRAEFAEKPIYDPPDLPLHTVIDIGKEEEEEGAVRKSSMAPSVSGFRQMHQDIQSLKGSTNVLSKYVDELHGSLMQTIDELWTAQKLTKVELESVSRQYKKLESSISQIEARLESIERSQLDWMQQGRIAMGITGLAVSIVGLCSIKASSFRQRSYLFMSAVCVLCLLNFFVSLVNLSRPILSKISTLKNLNF